MTTKSLPAPRVMVVRTAIVAMALSAALARIASAQDEAPPKDRTIEVGDAQVSDGSFKAGEYNGLQHKGANVIGNLDLRDNTPYTSTSAFRWSLKSADLGLDTRRVEAEVRVQGRLRLFFVFDQLRRNRSDTYETPYDGSGSNVLILPSSWMLPTIASPAGNTTSARGLVPAIGTAPYLGTSATNQGALLTPTAAQVALVNTAAAADLGTYHAVDLFTTRRDFNAGFTYHFDDRWSVDADVHPEHKDGLKPMSTVSADTGGDIATVIPDKIDNNHNQVTSSLHFTGTRGLAEVGYYGSFFTNNVPSMSWQNWATAAHTVDVMSSAPNNRFNQVTGTGAIKFGATSKIVADGSYGRATQNDAFLTDVTTPVVPVTSLNGLVVNRLAHVKYTARPWKKLSVLASYKYSGRDNRTPINIFQYSDAGAAPQVNANFVASPSNLLGAVVAQNANANRNYSRASNQVTLESAYTLPGRQSITAGYDFERLDRSCPGAWIDCEDASLTNEHTARVDWHASAGSNVTAQAGYSRAFRRGDYNENAFLALVPYAGVSPTGASNGATALSFQGANGWNGWGPALGFSPTTGNMNVFFPSNNALANTQYANNNRISELQGLRRYWVADRNRDRLRSSLTWQGSDVVSVQGAFNVNRDDYPDTQYGLQNVHGWATDIDATYTPADNFSADVFYTYERQTGGSTGNSYTANSNVSTIANAQPGAVFLSGNACDGYTTLQQRNNNNKLDPCLEWASDTRDAVHTVGVDVMRKFPKVSLTGNVTFTRSRSDDNVLGGNWANNPLNGPGGAPTTIAATFIPAAALPTVTNNRTDMRLDGDVPLRHSQSLHLSYAYLRMTSSDWMYEGTQVGAGTIAGVLPTDEQPFNYSVNVFGISYVMRF